MRRAQYWLKKAPDRKLRTKTLVCCKLFGRDQKGEHDSETKVAADSLRERG